MLVAGYAGVGKTSLVHELQRPVTEKRGYFVEGKFDQLQQTMPYSGWAQAITQLVNGWLAESEITLAGWRKTVLNAVGDYGQVLIDIIPALEHVIGRQPDVPRLGGTETQYRLGYYFSRFINSLAAPEHPLVIILVLTPNK